jgi:hypothetical protein
MPEPADLEQGLVRILPVDVSVGRRLVRMCQSRNIRFLPLPVDPSQMAMTCSLRSTGITSLQHYYGAV